MRKKKFIIIFIFSCLIYLIMMMIKMQIQRMTGKLFYLSFNWIVCLLFWIIILFFLQFCCWWRRHGRHEHFKTQSNEEKHSSIPTNINTHPYDIVYSHSPCSAWCRQWSTSVATTTLRLSPPTANVRWCRGRTRIVAPPSAAVRRMCQRPRRPIHMLRRRRRPRVHRGRWCAMCLTNAYAICCCWWMVALYLKTHWSIKYKKKW